MSNAAPLPSVGLLLGAAATTGPAGNSLETDAALALARLQIRAAGIGAETDAALALARVQIRAVGLATEAGSALALASINIRAAGLAAETDSALALTSAVSASVGVAAETDSALALSGAWDVVASTKFEDSGAGGTTPAVNTTGATLIVLSAVAYLTSASVSDSEGNDYIGLAGQATNEGGYQRLFYCLNPKLGASHTFTVGGDASAITVAAFRCDLQAAIDAESTGTAGSGTSGQPGSVTPSMAGALLVFGGPCGNDGSYLSAVDAGTVLETTVGTASLDYSSGIGYHVQVSAASINPTLIWNQSTSWAANVAVFVRKAGGLVGVASETNAAQARAAVQSKAAGVGAETDAAIALSAIQTKATGSATEADSALTLAASRPAGISAEADTAYALTPSSGSSVGLASETDSPLTLSALQTRLVGIATEIDAAQALVSAQGGAVGLAAETDAALTLTPQGGTGYAAETNAALPLTGAQIVALGLATDTETALALVPTQIIVVGLAAETDTAFGMSTPSVGAVGVATETDAALRLSVSTGGAGANPADVWNYVLSNGLTAEETLIDVHAWLRELYQVHGLEVGSPLTVTAASRTAAAIVQSVSEVAGAVTVTRQ